MPGVRELLERFRPAGAPGAATAAGVPAERRDAITAELQPVFAALAGTERECDALHEAATAAAGRLAAEAAGRARAILAASRADAPALRAATASRRRAASLADVERIAAAARCAAEDEDRKAGERLPGQVTAVVAAVRADLAALDGGDPR